MINSTQKEIRWCLDGIDETLSSMHAQHYRFTASEFMEVNANRTKVLRWLIEVQLKEFDYGRS